MHEKPRDDRGQGKHTAPPRAARKTQLKRRAATARRGSRPKNLPRATKDGGHLPRRSARREGSRTPCQKRENAPEATRSAAGIQGHRRRQKPRRGHAERPQDKHSNSRRTTCQGRPPEEQTRTAAEIRAEDDRRSGGREAATPAEQPPKIRSGNHGGGEYLSARPELPATRSARTHAEPRQHPRQGKTTTKSRGVKKRSQSSERGTPRRSAPETPAEISPEPPAATISAQNAQEARPRARAISDHHPTPEARRTRHRTRSGAARRGGATHERYCNYRQLAAFT